MSSVIRLDIVLREAVATPYSDLVTRQTGAAVRNRLLMVLRDQPGHDAHLDFSEVGLVDFSCADEVVAKLIVASADLPVPRVLLHGVRADHADAIEHALQRLGLVVVAVLIDSDHPLLLGAIPDDCRRAFDALAERGRAAAAAIALVLNWSEPRALEALEGLATRRCVLAHPDATFEFGAVA
jgi:hypothetical protein